MIKLGLARAANAAAHLQLFVASGIGTVLAIRAFLATTGYPKIAGGGLHLSHVLWGGLLMVLGLAAGQVFLGRAARVWGAVLGGAGFGFFIDEVGKFVSARPHYLYRPAAGIIYLVFAVLVVLTLWWRRRSSVVALSAQERTMNALDTALSDVRTGLTAEQRDAAIRLVKGSGRDLDAAVVQLLSAVPERRNGSAWRQWTDAVRSTLDRLAGNRWAVLGTLTYLIAQPFLTLGGAGLDGVTGELMSGRERGADLAVLGFALISAVLAVWGAVRLGRDRLSGLRLFHLAVLVDILLGQVFKFTVNQFAAVAGLAVDLVALWIITTEIRRATHQGHVNCSTVGQSEAREPTNC